MPVHRSSRLEQPSANSDRNVSMTLLDGGMGHLIKEWGVRIEGLPYEQQFLAGVLANTQDPDTVKRAHRSYIAAGSQCITTNNFAATAYNLAKVNKQDQVLELAQIAGALARSVAQECPAGQVMVAGCLPPLCESYQVTGLPAPADMVQQYKDIARALEPFVDVFLAETLSTAEEAQAAASATRNLGKPLWVSFTLEDSLQQRLRSQQPLVECLQQLLPAWPHIKAVLVNCCAPAAVDAAIPILAGCVPSGVRVGAYANGFKTTTTEWLHGSSMLPAVSEEGAYGPDNIITAAAYAQHARQWCADGASLVGGCCGVGPEHIEAVARVAGRRPLLGDHT